MKEPPPALPRIAPRRWYHQTDPDPAHGEDRPFRVEASRHGVLRRDRRILRGQSLPDALALPLPHPLAVDPPKSRRQGVLGPELSLVGGMRGVRHRGHDAETASCGGGPMHAPGEPGDDRDFDHPVERLLVDTAVAPDPTPSRGSTPPAAGRGAAGDLPASPTRAASVHTPDREPTRSCGPTPPSPRT